MLISYGIAWMFLPNASYSFPGVPNFDKSAAASVATLAGVLFFDYGRFALLRLQWFDWAISCLAFGPFLTSISNGLGPYDGVSASISSALIWIPPYLCGRLYLKTPEDYWELSRLLILGGLVYMPLCWIELRFSPQLHKWIYGFMQHSFAQHIRYGGFRPIVFMQHGLMVSFWMATATIVAFWLWRSRVPVFHSYSGGFPYVGMLLGTTVLCKSMNAIMLMLIGICFSFVLRLRIGKSVAICLLCCPAIWISVRASGLWSGDTLKSFISVVDEERAGSLAARMKQEDLFSIKARQRFLLGWGGWMRMFPTDEQGKQLTRGVDGYWVVAFGKNGFVGLVGYLSVLLQGPIYYFLLLNKRIPARCLPASAFAIIGGLFALDCLFNAMINPIFVISAAGLQNASRDWFCDLPANPKGI